MTQFSSRAQRYCATFVLIALTAVAVAAPKVTLVHLDASVATPTSKQAQPMARLQLGAIDSAKLLREDAQVANDKSVPYRYGVVVPLDTAQQALLNVNNGGWQVRAGSGDAFWQGEVFATDAVSVDVVLKPFWLPQHAQLRVFDAAGKLIWGPYGHEQNNLARTLPLPVVPGETLRLELDVPQAEREFVKLGVDSVGHGYRNFDGVPVAKTSGGCNVDVVCAAGNAYRDQIRGVVMLATRSGGRDTQICTGTLINTTRGDRSPLLITARHCEITAANAARLVAYYKYESPNCRPVSSGTVNALSVSGLPTQLGAAFVAAAGRSDFTLVRFNGAVPAAASPYWLGWDRRDVFPSGAVVIHHPSTDEKRISETRGVLRDLPFPLTVISPALAIGNGIYVEDYSFGTTEPGSSGSVLLTRDTKRIVGTLSGGSAACSGSTNSGYDAYGRIFSGWEGENTAATRLKDHLDPLGTAPQVLDGLGTCNAPALTLTSSASAPSGGDSVNYSATVTGGVTPYTFTWDIDGDGVDDRSGVGNAITPITTRYERAQSIDVRLKVTDALGCASQITRAVSITTPQLVVESAGASEQICGDNDGVFDPGERWRVRVNLRNNGVATAGALAQFGASTAGGPTATPLVVTQGSANLGVIANGQAALATAEVKIPESAACGAVLGLSYLGVADEKSFNVAPATLNLTLGASCNVVTTCATPASLALRGGSFYNPTRPGNGLVSFVIPRSAPQLPLFFGAWFTGEPNRNSTFYVVSGDVIGNAVNAQIFKTKRDLSAAAFSVATTAVGSAQFALVSPESMHFSYQFSADAGAGSNAGRRGAEIFTHLFKGFSPAQPDITGHYFNPDESGWGQTYESYVANAVAQQFIVSYLYDAAGEPRWVLGSFNDSLASGPANTYEVHCPGCAWLDIGPTFKNVGTQARAFPAGFGNALIGTQFQFQAPLTGAWTRTNATLQALSARQ